MEEAFYMKKIQPAVKIYTAIGMAFGYVPLFIVLLISTNDAS
jgi:ABC-type spermidine/putrescine transport system permease subunit II